MVRITDKSVLDYCPQRPSRVVYLSPVLANENQFA
jgi:hypothetical protein